MDESILLVYADQVRAGLVPHRDFYTVYGPAPFYALAGLFGAFGGSLVVERAFGLFIHLTVALGCYMLGRSRSRMTGLLSGGACLILLAPLGSVAYAWLGAIACLIAALALAERRGGPTHFGAGLMVGLAAAFRPELAIVGLPVLVPFLWRSSTWRWLVAGFAAGLAPTAWLFVVAGSRMWRNIGPGRAGINGSLRLMDDPLRSVTLVVAVVGVTSALVWLALKHRTRSSAAHALLALAILPQSLQRVDPEHALYTLCVTVPLVAVAVVGSESPDALRRRKMVLVAMAVAAVGSVMAAVLRPSPATVALQFGDRSAVIPLAEYAGLMETRSALLAHAAPGGSLFVGSTDLSRDSITRVAAYHLIPELRPSSYFLDLTGGAASRAGSGLAEDLRRSDVLLLTPMPEGLMEKVSPYAVRGSDEANSVVRTEFCRVAETGWGVIYAHHPCK
ncbi:hypothetical protein GCM10009868_08510 [Terrabacter aerolatus]|uniref:Glycosyltransferase RgtA/B/C/D-like domain-containing protein n=1 Tax=Terrabacter aerolatus TaxID=422442 RepID=A0A512D5W7_9MICO|nr:hypothetical protein TAE01_36740 [Terrabacter aerolatus]